MSSETTPPELSAAEAARRAKHDLGKYIAFSLRWLPPEASDAELTEALQADLLETRRGPRGVEGAASIWARLRGALGEGPERSAVDAHVAEITAKSEALAEGALSRGELLALSDHARGVAAQLAALARSTEPR